MELPRRSEQRDHPHRRYGGSLFPHVCLDVRLGKYRWSQVWGRAVGWHEKDLPATLLLYSESQPRLLLQRCAGDQVRVDELGEEPDEGRSKKLRGLTSRRAYGGNYVCPRYCVFDFQQDAQRYPRS